MWRSNAVMYVTVPYNKVLSSILYCLTNQSEIDFGIAHVDNVLYKVMFKNILRITIIGA
jgi:hypothetical protein